MNQLFRLFFLFLILSFPNIRLSAQALLAVNNKRDRLIDNQKERIPLLPYCSDKFASSLPSRVDNSELKYFSDIKRQWLPTCQQFSGIYNAFSYEINRLRDLEANTPSTIYPPSYTFNYLNTNNIYGVSFYYSFDVLKTQGQPDFAHYGILEDETGLYWMSGYENYLNAMQNRLHGVYRIPVNTPEGNLMMKNWIHNHLNRDSTGGVAIFGCSNEGTVNIPIGQYEQGKILLLKFGYAATHGITIAGYDDEVGYDINHDGIISNELDINDDGIVDMKDWEKGAYIVANSYGEDWGNDGFLYVLYSAMAYNYSKGGVWNESCYVLEPYKDFHPQLAMKAVIKHNTRNQLKIMAGISSDTSSITPQHTIDFLTSMYSGGAYPMKGIDTLPEPEYLEMGFDISPLLSYAESGKPAKVFLLVDEIDPVGSGNGKVLSFSVIDYTGSTKEYDCQKKDVQLSDNGLTFLSVNIQPVFDKPEIHPEDLKFSGFVPQQFQLLATKGETPYQWSMPTRYLKHEISTQLSATTGQEIYLLNTEIPQNPYVLPFSFPFCGKAYDTIYINHTGFVAFESSEMPYNYTTDGQNVLAALKCIGAAHQELILNANFHHCYARTNDTMCEIQWKFEFTYQGLKSLINCGVRLFSNGTFQTIYGSLPDVPSFPMALGYSDGTGSKEFLSTIFCLSDYSQKAFSYSPDYVNDRISLNENGLLTLNAQAGSVQNDFIVRVTDKNLITAEKSFVLHKGLEIKDNANIGSNKILEFSETCSIDCTIKNFTGKLLTNPVLSIAVDTSIVSISENQKMLADIVAGDSVNLTDLFQFSLKNKPGKGSYIFYSLSLTSQEFSTVKKTEIATGKPIIEKGYFEINDFDDKSLQPGEISACRIQILNSGSVNTEDLQCDIETDNPLVSIVNPGQIKISDIGSGCQIDLNFFLRADRSAEFGTVFNLNLKLYDSKVVDTVIQIQILLGKGPVYIFDKSPSSNTADSLMFYFDKNGIDYIVTETLPDIRQISGVSALFVTAGFENDAGLSAHESDVLLNYVENGGKLYFESKFVYWLPQTKFPLMDSLGAEIEKVQLFHIDSLITNNAVLPEGILDVITNSQKYSLIAANPLSGAESLLFSASSPSKVVSWGNKTEAGASIGSLVPFGQLRNRPGSDLKMEMVQKYLAFFNLNPDQLNPLFHTYTNLVCTSQPVSFSDDSYDNIVYRQWYFEGGEPEYSDIAEPIVSYATSGQYDVCLTVSDGSDTLKITKQNYIEVSNCTGKDEEKPEELKIFPNPSSGCYSVLLPGSLLYRRLLIVIYDCNGHMVLSRQVPEASASLMINISEYPSGIYLLRLIYSSGQYNCKLIKQ